MASLWGTQLTAGPTLLGRPLVSVRDAADTGHDDISDVDSKWHQEPPKHKVELSKHFKTKTVSGHSIKFPASVKVALSDGMSKEYSIIDDLNCGGRDQQSLSVVAADEREHSTAKSMRNSFNLDIGNLSADGELAGKIATSCSSGTGLFRFQYTCIFLHLMLDERLSMLPEVEAYCHGVYLGVQVTGDVTVSGAYSRTAEGNVGAGVDMSAQGMAAGVPDRVSVSAGYARESQSGPMTHLSNIQQNGGPPLQLDRMTGSMYDAINYLNGWEKNAKRSGSTWKVLYVEPYRNPMYGQPGKLPGHIEHVAMPLSLSAIVANMGQALGTLFSGSLLCPPNDPLSEDESDESDEDLQDASAVRPYAVPPLLPVTSQHAGSFSSDPPARPYAVPPQLPVASQHAGSFSSDPPAVPDDLALFLVAHGLGEYGEALVAAKEADLCFLLRKTREELIELCADLGMKKPDRQKLIAAVLQSQQETAKAPSVGGQLARRLITDGAEYLRNFQNTGLDVLYLPFRQVHMTNHGFTKKSGERVDSAIEIRTANIPDEFIEPDIHKEIILLVVGATGSGKSTQIDGMLNFILGVKGRERIRFKCVNEKLTTAIGALEAGASVSQTDMVTVYHIPAIKGGSVRAAVKIIDTPGFGDNRGLEFDKKTVDQLTKVFRDDAEAKKHVQKLTAVCFVTAASAVVLTEAQSMVWNSIMGLFSKDISSNVMVLFTFADGEVPQALQAIRASGLPFRKQLKFNNSALFSNLEIGGDISRLFWDMGSKSMDDFFNEVMTMDAVSLELTRAVLTEREKLENALEQLPILVKKALNAAEALRLEREFAQSVEETKHAAKRQAAVTNSTAQNGKPMQVKVDDWTYDQITWIPKKIPVRTKTTHCTQCDFTCHKDCAFDDADKQKCVAMNASGYCTACRQSCHYSQHVNVPWIVKYEERRERKTWYDLKNRYVTADSQLSESQQVINGLEIDIREKREEATQLIGRMKNCQTRLGEIALKPMVLPSEQYIEMMIENEKHNQKSGWSGRVKELEDLKQEAELLRKINTPDYDPLVDAEYVSKPVQAGGPARGHARGPPLCAYKKPQQFGGRWGGWFGQ